MDAITITMPQFSGTFSYKNDIMYRRSIGNGEQLVIERMDPNIAKIRFELEVGNAPVDIPDGVTVVLATSMACIPAARVGNEYFIVTWISNYHVLRQGDALFNIFNQQSHTIQPAQPGTL
jgi:hypothetical protein